MIPFLRSPSIKAVVKPEPIAPAAALLNPVAPINPPKAPAPAPVNPAVPKALPNSGAKKGKKASG